MSSLRVRIDPSSTTDHIRSLMFLFLQLKLTFMVFVHLLFYLPFLRLSLPFLLLVLSFFFWAPLLPFLPFVTAKRISHLSNRQILCLGFIHSTELTPHLFILSFLEFLFLRSGICKTEKKKMKVNKMKKRGRWRRGWCRRIRRRKRGRKRRRKTKKTKNE